MDFEYGFINHTNEFMKQYFFDVEMKHSYDMFEKVEDQFGFTWELISMELKSLCVKF